MVTRRAVFLVEALVAVLLVALLLTGLLGAIQSGGDTASRGAEMRVAVLLGQRLIDQLISDGHTALAAAAMTGPRPLDLEKLGAPEEPGSAGSGALSIDGCLYRADGGAEVLEEGLVAVRVTVSWTHARLPKTPAGSLEVSRLVAASTLTFGGE